MKFYKAGQIPLQPHMYFVYGDGGTGKTSLFRQFKGKKLLFSFDKSTNPLRNQKDIDSMVVEEDDFPNIQQLIVGFLQRAIKSGDYDAIALDNVTSLQNLVLENIDNASKDNRQNYQKLQLWFRQLGTMLRESNVEVYATAHQVDNGTSGLTSKGRYAADMNEKTFNAFTSMFDFVGRIYKQDGQRWINCDPEAGNHGKNRIDDRTQFKADELLTPKQEKENE
ncbi:AAA family ATPase [Limosilactobacillus oris]|uniref:AAA family ATPase n=1 Tax=Limosilactobacillus oris TaxID=1632 RepID=UPI0022368601|nr:AAA family ATPase [Limosilactobacillus oris]MCW4387104.1 AAA family ATPase [Limosilactobacillus oris]